MVLSGVKFLTSKVLLYTAAVSVTKRSIFVTSQPCGMHQGLSHVRMNRATHISTYDAQTRLSCSAEKDATRPSASSTKTFSAEIPAVTPCVNSNGGLRSKTRPKIRTRGRLVRRFCTEKFLTSATKIDEPISEARCEGGRSASYRGTPLLRNTPLSGPYSRSLPRVIWWS